MKQYKLEVFVPEDFMEKILETASSLGACIVGNYEHVAAYYQIRGCWKPNENAKPNDGTINKISHATEFKLEFRCPEDKVREVLKVVREIHPYDEALINVIKLDNELFE